MERADPSCCGGCRPAFPSTDVDAYRAGIEALHTMVKSFRDFAAITNLPETWAEAHTKISQGCSGFADAPGGLRDSAVAEQTASLTEVSALLIEGVGIMEAMSGKKSPGVIDSGAFRTILGSGLVHAALQALVIFQRVKIHREK